MFLSCFRTCPRFTCSKKGDGICNCLSGQRNCQAAGRPRSWATLSTFHVADKRSKEKEQCWSSQQQCWEQGRGQLESAVSSGEPQGIIMFIYADLKMKIPHICSVYVGFAVPPTQPLVLLMYLFSRARVVSGANWGPVSLHVSGAVWQTCLLSLLHLLFPNGGSLPGKEQGWYLQGQGQTAFPVCPTVHLCAEPWMAPTGHSSCCSALAGKMFELHSLTQDQDEGCLGIISLGNLELVTSMYSGEWDGTDGSAASWHIISHLPQPLGLKWGPGYGPTEGELWQQW